MKIIAAALDSFFFYHYAVDLCFLGGSDGYNVGLGFEQEWGIKAPPRSDTFLGDKMRAVAIAIKQHSWNSSKTTSK